MPDVLLWKTSYRLIFSVSLLVWTRSSKHWRAFTTGDAHSGLWFGLLTSVADRLTFALLRKICRMLCAPVLAAKTEKKKENLMTWVYSQRSHNLSGRQSCGFVFLLNSLLFPCSFFKCSYTTNQSRSTEIKIPTLPWKRELALLLLLHNHQTEKAKIALERKNNWAKSVTKKGESAYYDKYATILSYFLQVVPWGPLRVRNNNTEFLRICLTVSHMCRGSHLVNRSLRWNYAMPVSHTINQTTN